MQGSVRESTLVLLAFEGNETRNEYNFMQNESFILKITNVTLEIRRNKPLSH